MGIVIKSLAWVDDGARRGFEADAEVDLPSGQRSGVQFVELPQTATEEEVKNGILALYGAPLEPETKEDAVTD